MRGGRSAVKEVLWDFFDKLKNSRASFEALLFFLTPLSFDKLRLKTASSQRVAQGTDHRLICLNAPERSQ